MSKDEKSQIHWRTQKPWKRRDAAAERERKIAREGEKGMEIESERERKRAGKDR